MTLEQNIIRFPLKLRPHLQQAPERTKEVDMAPESTDPIERWTPKRRMTLVASLLKGDTSVAKASRKHGLTVGSPCLNLP